MIIITGASKGIGKYLCDEYSKQNFDIYGIFNSTFIESSYPKTKFSKLNTTNYDEIVAWFEEVKPCLKDITLINCAGIPPTIVLSGTFFVTTAPAATIEF